ncbi:hypothetical protein cyc_05614 [Cyclospora cayetanensis]|uniref:Mitochondrial carrier domain-containing protein n=1 Tax=Cyclospora cayetanensis TaxID=88456 RepID=A0A1D3D8Y7_9EIME|nr:hypothetical protein cyc_05614 [Cyclospora cayetanensis]
MDSSRDRSPLWGPPADPPPRMQQIPYEGGLLGAPRGPPDPSATISLSQSITAWHVLTYPIQTVRRLIVAEFEDGGRGAGREEGILCARYLSPTIFPVFPEYSGGVAHPSNKPAASAAAQTEVVDSPRGVPVVLRQPLLLASCSPSALNVFALVAHAMRVVYEAEGVSGLFRGLVPSCLHRLGRDCLHWLLLRHCYRGTVFLTRGVFATVGCLFRPLRWKRAENQREDSPEGSCEDGKDGKDSSSSSGSGRVQAIGNLRELFAELATYPLLVVSTRLAVIESPFPLSPPVFLPRVFSLSGFFGFAVDLLSSQMVVGTSEMLYLTLKADGAGAFWRGAVPYILSRSVDEAVTTLFFFTHRRDTGGSKRSLSDGGRRGKGSSEGGAAGKETSFLQQEQLQLKETEAIALSAAQPPAEQEEDSPVERRLQQLEEYTIRAWLSGKRNPSVRVFCLPLLERFSVLRLFRVVNLRESRLLSCDASLRAGTVSTQALAQGSLRNALEASTVKCDVFDLQPLMVQLGVCCLFLALSGAALATSHRRLSAIESEEEEELMILSAQCGCISHDQKAAEEFANIEEALLQVTPCLCLPPSTFLPLL